MGRATVTLPVQVEDIDTFAFRRDTWVGSWPPSGTQTTPGASDDDQTLVEGETSVTFANLVPGAEYAAYMDNGLDTVVLFNAEDIILEADDAYAVEGMVLTIIEGVPAWGYTTSARVTSDPD